jgi:tRNA(fMet)-specific endonuclease VapC
VYLLDNDIFSIYFTRRTRAPNLERKILDSLSRNQLFLPIIAVRQSVGGALASVAKVESSDRVVYGYSLLRIVLSGISEVPIIPFDDEAYAAFLGIPPQIRQAIGTQDSLIAATALRHDLIVATGNVQDFERVPGLTCENWTRLPDPANTV